MATANVRLAGAETSDGLLAAKGAVMSSARLATRKLELGDFHKGYLDLLAQLTKVGDYDEATFKGRFDAMAAQPDTYQIVVIEDLDKGRIIGTATLFIEQKFIRDCGKCGHIEDVVVDASYRGLRLGKRVIDAVIEAAEGAGCYKVILDCSDDNAAFYSKCGLVKKEIQMVRYF